MKIGIITFHASYNCGSILQCMALKQILENKGAEVEIINYSSEAQQKLYSVFYKKHTLKNIVKNFLCVPGYEIIKKHYQQYKEYIQDIFELKGNFYSTSEEIKKSSSKFDMLVAGGDQVWNVNCDDFSTAYFLDFDEHTYKISYSPSLGATDITKSPKAEEFKKLLNRFDAISCREINGKKWLEQLTGRSVDLIADPTMLLTAQQWSNKIQRPLMNFYEFPFIFYYAFSYSTDNNIRIQKIAEDNNLRVVVIDAKQWYIKQLYRYRNFVLCEETGPNTFLNLMKDSKCVITTSFHGTVFSLLYQKQFLYINGKNHEPTDDRTSFLLELMNLMDRYLFVKDITWEKLMESIDYYEVNQKIEKLRDNANNYLDVNMDKVQREGKT